MNVRERNWGFVPPRKPKGARKAPEPVQLSLAHARVPGRGGPRPSSGRKAQQSPEARRVRRRPHRSLLVGARLRRLDADRPSTAVREGRGPSPHLAPPRRMDHRRPWPPPRRRGPCLALPRRHGRTVHATRAAEGSSASSASTLVSASACQPVTTSARQHVATSPRRRVSASARHHEVSCSMLDPWPPSMQRALAMPPRVQGVAALVVDASPRMRPARRPRAHRRSARRQRVTTKVLLDARTASHDPRHAESDGLRLAESIQPPSRATLFVLLAAHPHHHHCPALACYNAHP
jgi:hypothetical protein